MGGRGSGSRMSASTSGGRGGSFMSNQQNMEDYAVAVGMFDRDFMRTEDGRAALREFMNDEIEAGLTESEMREAIRDTGSNRNRSTGGSSNRDTGTTTGGGRTYTESEVPSRIQSYTYSGTGASGDYEVREYVTRKGDAIKEVTTYKDGYKRNYTVMQNYPGYERSRAEYEDILAKRAKVSIRTGSGVTSIDGKKKDK